MAFQKFSENYLNILMVLLLEYFFLPLFSVWPITFSLYLNEALSGPSGKSAILPALSMIGSPL